MRILLLADAHSPHTQKWVRGLLDATLEVGLFSLSRKGDVAHSTDVRCHLFLHEAPVVRSGSIVAQLAKLRYLDAVSAIRSAIDSFQPDVVHAHYASSYGFLGSLACPSHLPYLVSVWGSDVYDFPQGSFVHRSLIRFVLSRARTVMSTSSDMAKVTSAYTDKKIEVVPFGVDLSVFTPQSRAKGQQVLTFGCAKLLEKNYGQALLLRALGRIKREGRFAFRLLLVGDGSQRELLTCQSEALGLGDDVVFMGAINHARMAEVLKDFDIAVYPSEAESFGVSAVEAGACGLPVIATRVGGLREVIDDGVTGLLVTPKSEEDLVDKLSHLATDPNLQKRLGNAARARVERLYDWRENVARMVEIYGEAVSFAE